MSEQPNVLLICTDHWFGSLIGAAGHPVVQTPTLDNLAHCGVRFRRAYSACPVCIPARRTLMTGVSPRRHGDRVFNETQSMPDVPTVAQTFRKAGYQASAVGKLHVYPQRDRIGFDDVILDEEGRTQYGVTDDYELYLGDVGYAGRHYDHGMSNNQYNYRPWHLPEETHVTNWATRMMSRTIRRRDPTKAAFWYLSYRHPHPPLVPLQAYLDLYRDIEMDSPGRGTWLNRPQGMPYAVAAVQSRMDRYTPAQLLAARRAFYALCTHIDHQLRVVIGTLREEAVLDDTIICFVSDHGDMLGQHHMLGKRVFYENSSAIPMILVGRRGDDRVSVGAIDDRLVGLQDVMPTLLDLCGIEVPSTVEGLSMVRSKTRPWLYGECSEGYHATRMVHDGRFKLIYYPVGNCRQLFDLEQDPAEITDLSDDPGNSKVLERLSATLISQLYGGDEEWVRDGRLVGYPDRPFIPGPDRGLASQRGDHWPAPPKTDIVQIEWHSDKERE